MNIDKHIDTTVTIQKRVHTRTSIKIIYIQNTCESFIVKPE